MNAARIRFAMRVIRSAPADGIAVELILLSSATSSWTAEAVERRFCRLLSHHASVAPSAVAIASHSHVCSEGMNGPGGGSIISKGVGIGVVMLPRNPLYAFAHERDEWLRGIVPHNDVIGTTLACHFGDPVRA